MNKPITIYTAGRMTDTPLAQQMGWRRELESAVLRYKPEDAAVRFIHPPLVFGCDAPGRHTEAQIMEWELTKLAGCRVMAVDLKDIHRSIGTHMEMGYANAVNARGDGHIFVIGIGSAEGLHPWIRESLFRVEPDVRSAAEYIAEYLLD